MCDCDNTFLVAFANFQITVLGCQRALGDACRIGALAQDIADDGIALARLPRLALARRFIVARTQCRPRGEPVGIAKTRHIVADLDQDHGAGASRSSLRTATHLF